MSAIQIFAGVPEKSKDFLGQRINHCSINSILLNNMLQYGDGFDEDEAVASSSL